MLISKKVFSNNKRRDLSLLRYLQIIFFVGLLFYFGKILFIPLFYGLFIAIVLYPVCKYLERKGWPKSLAVTVCLLIVTILIAALVLLLILEIKAFTKDLPQLQPTISLTIQQFQQWLLEKFDISIAAQTKWINDAPADLKNKATNLIQGTLQATLDTLFMAFMVPVYTALFLYGRGTFIRSLQAMVDEKYKSKLQIILHKTIRTYHKYVKGMILVYLIVGVLNSVGLFALGVKHAILFGMLTAIMTIIPYIGIIVSALLPISLAWITTGSIWIPLSIVAVFVFVQYLEANVIFPNVVGAQLNVNTWATLISIIAGGIIWGVSGMILFIPFVAILKIIADEIDDWKPLRILLSRKD
jgi:predicted PurR-regulated permease PerM